jgi:hypothetical protein
MPPPRLHGPRWQPHRLLGIEHQHPEGEQSTNSVEGHDGWNRNWLENFYLYIPVNCRTKQESP